MDDKAIKQANRKALPKFLLVIAASVIVGGVIGYFSAKYDLGAVSGSLQEAEVSFGMHIAPWLMLAVAIVVPIVCVVIYRSARKLFGMWDDEDEDICDAIDRKLSVVTWIASAAFALSCFLLAASYCVDFDTLENKESAFVFFISLAAFFAIVIEVIIIQQKCVDTAKQMHPEKKASVYDLKFQKKWMDSCDEAEKIMIGKCAFKAYSTTNVVCLVLSIVLGICALVFAIGCLPSLVVCLVWIVNQSVYCKEAFRYSKAGNKIS